MTKEKIKIFVDMDGTLAEWKASANFEDLYKENYFLNLKPHDELIKALNVLKEEFDIYVLSSYLSDSKYALKEKNMWLDKHFNIPMVNRLFLPCGYSKNIYSSETSLLIDDYSKNLTEWSGKKIKALNGANGSGVKYRGARLDVFSNYKNQIQMIKETLK